MVVASAGVRDVWPDPDAPPDVLVSRQLLARGHLAIGDVVTLEATAPSDKKD